MSRRIVIDLPERVAKRLNKTDWHLSIGHGVKVPGALREAQARIRWALANDDADRTTWRLDPRVSDPIVVRVKKDGPEYVVRPCSGRHRDLVLAGYIVLTCDTCRPVLIEDQEGPPAA